MVIAMCFECGEEYEDDGDGFQVCSRCTEEVEAEAETETIRARSASASLQEEMRGEPAKKHASLFFGSWRDH